MFENLITHIGEKNYNKQINDADICDQETNNLDRILSYKYSLNNSSEFLCKYKDCSKINLDKKINEDLVKFSKIYNTDTPDNNIKVIKDDLYLFKLENSNIINYTPFEQALYSVCNKYNITYTIVNNNNKIRDCIVNLTYEVINKTIDPCVLSILSITDHIQKCDYTINISEEECIFAYNILKEDKTCNLTLQQYQQLLSVGWTPYSLETIYSNQYSLSEDGKILKTSLNYYLVDDIPFDGINTADIKDERKFLELALKDVDIPSAVKNEILNK